MPERLGRTQKDRKSGLGTIVWPLLGEQSQDYAKPMRVATYKTSKDMSTELRKALPDIDDLRKLLDVSADTDDEID